MAHPYVWILVMGCIVSFLTGGGVGMNDLANAFGTTYGAKVLTLKQICILASICEFSGAVGLGGAVTSTISGGIANTETFESEPYIFMYGMLCALGAAFCWLCTATYLVLPVSSTHSICGGVLGFALAYGGPKAVNWAKPQDEFPFVGGLAPIIASWFISPVLAGSVAAGIFSLLRILVFRTPNPVKRALFTLPIIVLAAVFFESFYVLFKGAKGRLHWSVGRAAWVAAIIAVGASLCSIPLVPFLQKKVKKMEADAAAIAEEEGRTVEEAERDVVLGLHPTPRADVTPAAATPQPPAVDSDNEPVEDQSNIASVEKKGQQSREMPPSEAVVVHDDDDEEDAHAAVGPEATAAGIVEDPMLNVEMFDPRAEYVFRYLQIFTAICASFSHGASDVSNAVGPLAAIYGIYRTNGDIESSSSVPIWILCLGGAGLVVGLSTFGVRLMRLLGEKITVITPSRGFSAELAAALVVSFASGYGIPVSSTHCITGAVVAISMMDVGVKQVRWMMVLKMYGGWIGTLFVTGIVSAMFFAQGVYSPSKA